MLELSEIVLKRGYTITISKLNGQKKLQGSYKKRFPNGLHPYELPETELQVYQELPNILERLEQGEILQITKPMYLFEGIIGIEKLEGPYGEISFLEEHEENKSENLRELLCDLDIKLATSKTQIKSTDQKQYRKLYKGEDRYE